MAANAFFLHEITTVFTCFDLLVFKLSSIGKGEQGQDQSSYSGTILVSSIFSPSGKADHQK